MRPVPKGPQEFVGRLAGGQAILEMGHQLAEHFFAPVVRKATADHHLRHPFRQPARQTGRPRQPLHAQPVHPSPEGSMLHGASIAIGVRSPRPIMAWKSSCH